MEYKNSTEDRRGREGKLKGKKPGKEKHHERLITIGNKQLLEGRWVGGRGNWVMGVKEARDVMSMDVICS